MRTAHFFNLAPLLAIFCQLAISTSTEASAPARTLSGVLKEARTLTAQGIEPVIVMDLDETTVNSIPRRFASLQVALRDACSSSSDGAAVSVANQLDENLPSHGRDCDALKTLTYDDLNHQQNRYDFSESLRHRGIEPSAWTADLEKAMVAEYLSGRHIELDTEVVGAAKYIKRLHEASAKTVYVSSRFSDVQGTATEKSLETLRFSQPANLFELFLRTRGETSIEFKEKSYGTIKSEVAESPRKQVVVAVFENEPENLNALAQFFPEAARFFVTGAQLKAAALPSDTNLIENFRY